MGENEHSGTVGKSRYYPRLAVEILLSYRPEGASADTGQVVTTKSLGLGGLMFEADTPFVAGEFYILDLVFGERKKSLKARVIYSLPVEDGKFEVGFAFQDITDEQREELTALFIREYEKLPPESL